MSDRPWSPSFARFRRSMEKFDWRRRDVTDAIAIFGALVLIYLVVDTYQLSPKLFQFALDHADMEADDAILVIVALAFALLIYVSRRKQDLAREIKARVA